MPETIYIAGKMRGIPQYNFPAFFEAEEKLSALGYSPINPAHNDGPTLEEALANVGPEDDMTHSWKWYMQRDVPQVIHADRLCVLPGWQNSPGANLEVHIANALGIPIWCFSADGEFVPRVRALGLSAYAQSGKDTVADYLVQRHGFTRVAYADILRDALYTLDVDVVVLEATQEYSLPHDDDIWLETLSVHPLCWVVDNFGWEIAKKHTTARELLQRLGTEVGRKMFGEDFWTQQAIRRIPDGAKVVITDVRFPNETPENLLGIGQTWRIERPGYGPVNGHPSETAMDGYPFTTLIKNESTLEDLYIDVEEALSANPI